ncbi:MAG: hypothetical protein DRO98_04220 [Archaeoglobales archaeon]|nr:MAG: hypothetical protein DRO98_04220 [Archaeoglobales archaeon]
MVEYIGSVRSVEKGIEEGGVLKVVKRHKRHKKYCAEIFGFPPENRSEEAKSYRETFTCPFRGKECDPDNKVSNLTDEDGNLLVEGQTGECSVWHNPSWSEEPYPVITCPYRFLEGNVVLNFIKEKFFNNNEIVVAEQVDIPPFGRADALIGEIIKKDDSLDIGRIAHLEYQADGTTGTRGVIECIRDFRQGIDVTKKDYDYGLNSKASVKGASLQMINKGYLFQELRIPSIWVLQDYLFRYLRRIYNFDLEDVTDNPLSSEGKYLYFLITKLEYDKDKKKFILRIDKCYVTTPEDMQKSIMGKTHEITIDKLRKKILTKADITCGRQQFLP